MNAWRPAALALALLLGACATAPPVTVPPQTPGPGAAEREAALWGARRAALQDLTRWQARGKVAYRLPDSAGSASLHWQQEDDGSALRLAGPFGAGAVQISMDGPLLKLRRDGIERRYPADAAPWLGGERLLPIPVDALQHWLRGLPDPQAPVDALDTEDGLARHLEQRGWRLDYGDYNATNGLQLPARITISVPGAELTLRLLLREWEFAAEGLSAP